MQCYCINRKLSQKCNSVVNFTAKVSHEKTRLKCLLRLIAETGLRWDSMVYFDNCGIILQCIAGILNFSVFMVLHMALVSTSIFNQYSHYIETSQMICSARQLAKFCMMRNFVVNGLKEP